MQWRDIPGCLDMRLRTNTNDPSLFPGEMVLVFTFFHPATGEEYMIAQRLAPGELGERVMRRVYEHVEYQWRQMMWNRWREVWQEGDLPRICTPPRPRGGSLAELDPWEREFMGSWEAREHNMVYRPAGAIRRRPGTRFVAEVSPGEAVSGTEYTRAAPPTPQPTADNGEPAYSEDIDGMTFAEIDEWVTDQQAFVARWKERREQERRERGEA